MKLNTRGFAISSIMYIILVLAVILIAVTLSLLSSRKLVLDKIKNEVLTDIYGEEQICTLISGVENAIGSKYECEVKQKNKYNFFVISHEDDGTTNLIMDRNICEDGIVATETSLCYVKWEAQGETLYGPVVAMNYIYNATKDWVNIQNIVINYKDEGTNYGSIITTDNVTNITRKNDVSVTASYTNLKARLPYYSEVGHSNGTNEYLYENMHPNGWEGAGVQPTNNIKTIQGYWILSSNTYNSAWYVKANGKVSSYIVDSNDWNGVRPVINVKL